MGKGLLMLLGLLMLSGCGRTQHTSELAQTRLQLGLEYLARDDLTAAQRNLQQAVKLAPHDYRNQLALARYQQRAGQRDAALSSYEMARKLAGQNREVINNYGAFLCHLGQYDAAQQQFSRAAELAERGARADAVENAGYCSLLAGDLPRAKAALIEATQHSPEKGMTLLAEADRRFGKKEREISRLLLDVYQRNFTASAESLWLEIRFAALAEHPEGINEAGQQLARNFPQSIQYLRFLANEY